MIYPNIVCPNALPTGRGGGHVDWEDTGATVAATAMSKILTNMLDLETRYEGSSEGMKDTWSRGPWTTAIMRLRVILPTGTLHLF